MPSPQSEKQPLDHRAVVWTAAKLAVRSYARDPSSQNAGEVERAWTRVRRVMAESARLRIERRPRSSKAAVPQG